MLNNLYVFYDYSAVHLEIHRGTSQAPPRSGGATAARWPYCSLAARVQLYCRRAAAVTLLCSRGTITACYIFNEYSAVYLAVLYAASEEPLRSGGTAVTSKKHKYHSKKPAAKEVAPLIMK